MNMTNMDKFKPIETSYKGYRFRSRLEARWAVFFDVLGIKWEYETQGFHLSDGTMYLPDFWLPTFNGGMYVEVKPIGGDFSKATQLALDSGKAVWLAEGEPTWSSQVVVERMLVERPCLPMWGDAESENRMYVDPEEEQFYPDSTDLKDEIVEGSLLHRAVCAARQARFENKENQS